MNRKRIKRLILNCITVACVTNTLGLMNVSYAFADNKKSEVTRSEESFKNSELLNESFDNESFDKVIKEENNTYKTWWKDETRPLNWQLRKWAGAAATGDNTPYGEVTNDNAMTGGKYVKVSCNNSVGFFQPDSYVNISPNTDYNISIKMKTTDISANEPLYLSSILIMIRDELTDLEILKYTEKINVT